MINQSKERRFGPKVSQISKVNIPEISPLELDNGLPLYEVNLGTQDVIKFEWVFKAGKPFEKKHLVSRATASQMKEGTSTLNSFQIAEQTDFLGASLRTSASFDTASISVFSLRKHFPRIIPLIRELWLNPAFPQDELDKFKMLNQQNLKLELTKNDVIAYRELTLKIFGDQHPYGYNSYPESYEALERADLTEHFNRCYGTNNSFVIISGKLDKHLRKTARRFFGKLQRSVPLSSPKIQSTVETPRQVLIRNQAKNSSQAAIRLGRKLFNRNHPDYGAVFLLNTVLGGYFGSRLMKSIREEKGYTYNIYSALDMLWLDGYFYIHTEVGNEYLEATRKQIFLELKKLREELIPEKELKMVKNYLLGNILGMLDGPFKVSKVVKSLALHGKDFSDFNQMVQQIIHCTNHDLRNMAQKYLDPKDLWEIIVR